MHQGTELHDVITGQWGFGPGQFTLIMDERGMVKGYTDTVKIKRKRDVALVDVYATDPLQAVRDIDGDGSHVGRYRANLGIHKRIEEQQYGGGYISVKPDDGTFNLTWKGKDYGRGKFDSFNTIIFATDLI